MGKGLMNIFNMELPQADENSLMKNSKFCCLQP